jgi:hypothetical protein
MVLADKVAMAWLLSCGAQPRDILVGHYDFLLRTSKLAMTDRGFREARDAVASAPVEFFKEVAEAAGASLIDVVKMFKDSRVVRLFSKVGWSLNGLWEALKSGYEVYRHLRKVLSEYLSGTKVGSWTRKEMEKLDVFLSKHPVAKRISGVAVGALLLYIWFNMAFVGDPAYDFDLSEVLSALGGSYTLASIFAGPDGMERLVSLGLGVVGLSFPWPGPTAIKFAVTVVGTMAKKLGMRLKYASALESPNCLNQAGEFV